MGKTYRREPSNKSYMKQPRNRGYRQLEEMAEDGLYDLPAKHSNRVGSRKTRISDAWDNLIITEYRGQKFHREK